jgi:hypothetical protein
MRIYRDRVIYTLNSPLIMYMQRQINSWQSRNNQFEIPSQAYLQRQIEINDRRVYEKVAPCVTVVL